MLAYFANFLAICVVGIDQSYWPPVCVTVHHSDAFVKTLCYFRLLSIILMSRVVFVPMFVLWFCFRHIKTALMFFLVSFRSVRYLLKRVFQLTV